MARVLDQKLFMVVDSALENEATAS